MVTNLNNEILITPVDDCFAAWFKASHRFMLLAEPAYFVLEKYFRKMLPHKIAIECEQKYGTSGAVARKFVYDVIAETESGMLSPESSASGVRNEDISLSLPENCIVRDYAAGKINLRITYGDPEMVNLLHPLIAHMEKENHTGDSHSLGLIRSDGLFILTSGDEIAEIMPSDQSGFFKAAVFMKLLCLLYNMTPGSWMMSVHASGITDGRNAVLFPASVGRGKSTLSALLNAKGYDLLSDDFVMLDNHSCLAYELPLAMTIKEGSFDVLKEFFPELEQSSLSKASTGKMVRYLTPKNHYADAAHCVPVRGVVFVSFSPGEPFSFEKTSRKEAFKALLGETWINPEPKNVRQFFDWFNNSDFYAMSYSRTEDALNAVSKLLENDGI